MLNQKQSKRLNLLKLLFILPLLTLFLVAFNTKTEYKEKLSESNVALSNDKSFEYVIKKSTSNEELESIKSKLKNKNIDFSYTSVRAENDEIQDLEVNVVGYDVDGQYFALDYSSDSKGPIEDVLIYHNQSKKEFFIGKKDTKKEPSPTLQTKAGQGFASIKSTPANKTNFSARVTNITIGVDKNSSTNNLNKDSKYLADNHGIKVGFKGIKRNDAGEITAIKVIYDNGAGDKGHYQQKKSRPITPFKVRINLNEDAPAEFEVIVSEEMEFHASDEKHVKIFKSFDEIGEHDDIIIKSDDKHGNVWVSKGAKKHEVIEIKTDGDNEMIFLNGKEISKDSLKNMGRLQKTFVKAIEAGDKVDFDAEIIEVKVKGEDGKNEVIKLHPDKSSETSKRYVFISTDKNQEDTGESQWKVDYNVASIEFEDSTSTKGNANIKKSTRIKTHFDDKKVGDNVFIIKSDEAGDYSQKMRIHLSEKDALIFIDDEEASYKEMKKLSPEEIKSIDVSKGDEFIEEYGQKAKNGVIKITTKKKN